ENAENGNTDGWQIYDATPEGATIENVFDGELQSMVIEMAGDKTNNGFKLLTDEGILWKNTNEFVIEWLMKFEDNFYIFVELKTSSGLQWLRYKPIDDDFHGTGKIVEFGLGSHVDDGQWQWIVRDLQEDLSEAQPGVSILEVNAIYFRGSGRVDDIKLRSD
ncbi:MAG: hypothetical protein GY814_00875, partial [Gammaproteobacteria bacterium]|nr:hypothetical protein [Gammaproteobacteria bacterium]